VARALEKSREARYPTIEALAQDLATIDEHWAGAIAPAIMAPTRAGAATMWTADLHASTVAGAADTAAVMRRTESVDPHELTELQTDHVRVTTDTVLASSARSTDTSGPPAERFPTDVPQVAGAEAAIAPRRRLGRMLLAVFGSATLAIAGVMWMGEDETPPPTVTAAAAPPGEPSLKPVVTKQELPVSVPVAPEMPPAVDPTTPPTTPPTQPPKAVGKKTPKKTPVTTPTSPSTPVTSPPPPLEKRLADTLSGEMAHLRDSAAMRECFTSHNAVDKRLAVDIEIDADTGRVTGVTVPALIRGSALARCVERVIRGFRFSTAPGESDHKVKQFALNK
jgi:hypothetical protein